MLICVWQRLRFIFAPVEAVAFGEIFARSIRLWGLFASRLRRLVIGIIVPIHLAVALGLGLRLGIMVAIVTKALCVNVGIGVVVGIGTGIGIIIRMIVATRAPGKGTSSAL